MSGADSQNSEKIKDNMSTNSIDEGLPRDMSKMSLSTSASQEKIYFDKGHAASVMKKMLSLFQSEKLHDVVLIVEGRRIPAHKVVLASCSEYFTAMFSGSLREASLTDITLNSIDPQALQTIVNYCYTGKIELREDTVEALLSTSCILQMNTVKYACCAFLTMQLDPCNCLGIAMFAEYHACTVLNKSAMDYTYHHFMQVVKHEEFIALDYDQVSKILSSKYLNVEKEEDVFESLMLWVQHCPQTREKHLPTLLQLIKLPLLSREYLIDQVDKYCGHLTECRLLIMEVVKWHLLPHRRSLLPAYHIRPRIRFGRLLTA